jgi:hypothetical protein
MALTDLQRTICGILAENRLASGESYVAGGVALNELIAAARLSADIDLFHDTDAALAASWHADRGVLEERGFAVTVVRERPTFVEAEVVRGGERVRLEWARDSAFRFFPLVRHDVFGLVLHPFDLATNKVLALAGRLEVRDWVDLIATAERLQPLGYLAWAACAKDPGYGPAALIEAAARSGRYSAEEVRALSFAGSPPDAGALSRTWHGLIDSAREIVSILPPAEVGACLLDPSGDLLRSSPEALRHDLDTQRVRFHHGRIRGAMPRLIL